MNKFQAAFLALAAIIDARLTQTPVTFSDGGERYEVNGLDRDVPAFKCRALSTVGNADTGDIKRLPVDDHYAKLVLGEMGIWVGDEPGKALAAGAGAHPGPTAGTS
jgi:hypothetical protein